MDSDSGFRKFLIGMFFALLAAIAFGLIWFFFWSPASPVGAGWYFFSFAAGLSMIVLPCTLPLAFIIVPLSMGKGVAKGFAIALAFGLGVAFTLSLYGVLAAVLGKVAIGSLGAPLEVVKNWLYFIAGAFAFIFALGELGLVRFRMPSYGGAFPGFIQRQKDVLKALLLGLFLGNIGVGCPHPATPVILTRIAVSGDVFYGWLLFLVHAIGRILPLLFLAILGILGVNLLSGLVKNKERIARATGWGMVFVAGFILVLGLFSHDWWVLSGIHTYLEELTGEEKFLGLVSDRLNLAAPHAHGLPPSDHTGLFGLPLSLGTWAMLFLWILPLFWYYRKKKKENLALGDSPEKEVGKKVLRFHFWNVISVSLVLILVFGYILPNRFLNQTKAHMMEGDQMMENMEKHMGEEMAGDHAGHIATYHEESEVREGLVVHMTQPSAPELDPEVYKEYKLSFVGSLLPEGKGVPEADLEVAHDKKMHVIGVRRDLNEFFHIHPVAEVPDSPVLTAPHVFQKPGEYKIWSEIKYQGENHVFGHPILNVSGTSLVFEPSREVTKSRIVGNYQVVLDYDGIFTDHDNHLDFSIKDSSGGDTELENYLGEKMHLTVISEDLSQFIHTHPDSHSHTEGIMGSGTRDNQIAMISEALANGNEKHGEPTMKSEKGHIGFTLSIKKSGFYKVFAQFKPQGAFLGADEALLAEFWIEAIPSKEYSPGISPWWRNLLVSIGLMVLLGILVKRFITIKGSPQTKNE